MVEPCLNDKFLQDGLSVHTNLPRVLDPLSRVVAPVLQNLLLAHLERLGYRICVYIYICFVISGVQYYYY